MMRLVGMTLWIAAGFLAFAATRPVRIGRTRWSRELIVSAVTAFCFGVSATALDFGGWNEPDWRAGLFSGLGALTAIAVVRIVSLTRPAASDPASRDGRKR